MMRVAVNGAAGHMGGILVNLIEMGTEGATLACAVDKFAKGGTILNSFDGFSGECDAAVDFSHHSAVGEFLSWAVRANVPAVIATTGHDEGEKAEIYAAAEKIPVFFASNMSMGIALLGDMVQKMAAAFPEADVEIIEKHHNRKVDAPSGTAITLFEAVKAGRPDVKAVYGRGGMGKREANDVGIHAVRMGNVVGEHEVIFTTNTQSITLKHEAFDRALFAEGALKAAKFLVGKSAGLYGMKDLISAE